MPKIYLGLEKPMVCWHVAIQDNAAKAGPGFKEAKKAMLNGWEWGQEQDGKVVGDLMSLWAQATQNDVKVKWCWNTVALETANYEDVTIVAETLMNREEDEWLLDRYRDSLDLREWRELGRRGELLMAMLELAKRGAHFDEAVSALCRRVNSLILNRPRSFLDAALWRKEKRLRKLRNLRSA